MTNSLAYSNLCRRIGKIERAFLPSFKPLGNYTSKEQDDTRAYCLLTHAEIESYIETVSRNKVQFAFTKWRSNHKYNSQVLLSLSCFTEQSAHVKQQRTVEKKLAQIVGIYCLAIKNNNGIKEENICHLVLPLGIEESALDSTWLNTLNSFGSQRGAFAHTGASVTSIPDPISIKSDVDNILLTLKDLDIQIKALR